jgi:membrane protease YdiL (CAAX protease family)
VVAALVIALGVLVVANLLNNRWLPRAYLVTCPVAAVVLLVVGRLAGLSWTELGLGRGTIVRGLVWAAASIGVVALGYAVALAVPAARRVAEPAGSRRSAFFTALVEVPLGTVLLEELAFRGVLWGLVARDHGTMAALVVTAVLFGLWHVLPAVNDDTIRKPAWGLTGRRGTAAWVVATVLFTAAAGVLFGLLRVASNSVLAPMGLHWATNGLGSLFRLAAR